MEDFFSLTLSLYRPYVKKLEYILTDYELNVARWLILKDIYYHQPTSLVDIAKRRYIEKSTTRQILKVFEEKRFIRTEVNEVDKRHKIIHLTNEGKSLFTTINQRILKMDDDILSNVFYTDDTYEQMRQFIKQLLINMKGSN